MTTPNQRMQAAFKKTAPIIIDAVAQINELANAPASTPEEIKLRADNMKAAKAQREEAEGEMLDAVRREFSDGRAINWNWHGGQLMGCAISGAAYFSIDELNPEAESVPAAEADKAA